MQTNAELHCVRATVPAQALAVLLCSCATNPTPNAETKPVPPQRILNAALLQAQAHTGVVAVKRDPGSMAGGCYTELLVDEHPVARLKAAERLVLHLPLGEHVLSARPVCPLGAHGLAEVAVTVSADAPSSYRIGVGSGGDMAIYPTTF